MLSLLEAIAKEEGFFVQDSRPQRNNNPGDLIWGPEAQRFGATHGDPHFAVFPDVETGWEALRRWLSVPAHIEDGKLVGGYCGATLEQVVKRFAPPAENDSGRYLYNVCLWTGLQPADLVTQDIIRPEMQQV